MFVQPLGYSTTCWDSVRSICDRAGIEFPLEGNETLGKLSNSCKASGLSNKPSGWELDNFYISFYIECEHILPILSKLSLTQVKDAYILNGSISCWEQALVTGLCFSASTETRQVLGMVYAFLKSAGFGYVLDKYSIFNMSDGTFILKVKR